jgi:hypothetical protein
MTDNDLEAFCRQIRARSAEHRVAVERLHSLPGQIMSILRQELDSLVRVIFLLSQNDPVYRHQLIHDSVNGKRWTEKGSKKPITDRAMVLLANDFEGWTKSVYKFGCAFIHLSKMHDYKTRDPLQEISMEEKDTIVAYLRYYHNGEPSGDNVTLDDITPLLPEVFKKIADNLDYYLQSIENDGDIDK